MSPYALTKLVGEQYCKLFYDMYGIEVNSIRPFNVYGKRQDPGGSYAAAVPKFIDSLKKGETPFITGDGKQVRDYIYVDDVVQLMILAGKSEVYGEAFNAGSGKNISINKLYELIAKTMNKNIKANHIAEVFEPKKTLADISKAKKLLGWKSKVDLEEGIKKSI
jgi:nucleoside-diphosphate-sugar epimerase